MAEPTSFIHPDKMNWINKGDEDINALLPNLSPAEHSYLQLITSESYKTLVANLKKYIGYHPTKQDLPEVVGLLFSAQQKAIALEAKHVPQLEELALNTVLGLEEFHIVQEAYVNGEVKFQVSLSQPSVSDYQIDEPQAPEGGLTEEESLNAEFARMFGDVNLNDAATRRRLANLLITGGAFSKMYLFHLVEPKLNVISPELIKLYGILGVAAELGYWCAPDGIEQAEAGVGVEEVKPDQDGTYTIKAKATTFPYLIHEIVKGIYEWLSIDPEMKQIMGGEKLEHETRNVLTGPAIFKKIINLVPSDKQQYMPLIQKKLIALPTIDAQEVLKQSPRGKSLFNQLIAQSESEWEQYKQDKSTYNDQ